MISKLFKHQQRAMVGLDIGNSSVKVVQLSAKPKDSLRQLMKYAITTLPDQKKDTIAKTVRKTMEEAQITESMVNTSVSGQSIIVRYIQMPQMTHEELGKALALQINKYIPFDIREVNYDYQILGQPQKKDKTMRVLLVAAKKDFIKERTDILNDAGLTPNIVDVDAFAIINSFQLIRQESSTGIAVVDVGGDVTTITIIKDGLPQFNRDVLIGGRHFTQVVMEELEVDEQEAENLKRDPQHRYGDVINAMRPIIDRLCGEINLSFNYCESQIGQPVTKIYLTGGMAKFKGIDKVLNSIVGVDVEVWDPTRVLTLAEGLSAEGLQAIGPLLTVAVGLALRE